MGRNQAADAIPVDFQLREGAPILIEGEDAVDDSAQRLAMHGRQMRLRVEVDQKHPLLPPRHGGGEVERGSRLADPAFLIENGDTGHVGQYIYKHGFFT